MKQNRQNTESQNLVIYTDDSGKISVSAVLIDKTIWLTQKQLAELFEVERSVISKHVNNIFNSLELKKDSVCAKFAHTAEDGKVYNTDFYNLDMIIAVGYRVNSKKATAFRIWATSVLKEYLVKGAALDDERLKAGGEAGIKYFKEILERIKDIRISERLLYQQLKDIYALSADYNDNREATLLFFAAVQNKVHYAISGMTAAEIIYKRVDGEHESLGLTTWEKSPDNTKIRKSDVEIAKNYLTQLELEELRYIVNAFLDYAEHQAKNQQLVYMRDWITQLDDILTFNKKVLLEHSGTVSRMEALERATQEYAKYRLKIKEIERVQSEQELLEDIKLLESLLVNKNKTDK